jgi:hypothetical protein
MTVPSLLRETYNGGLEESNFFSACRPAQLMPGAQHEEQEYSRPTLLIQTKLHGGRAQP